MAHYPQSLVPPPRRVVITGMGVIAPNGQDLETFWHSIRDGISPVGLLTRFDTRQMPNKLAAEVTGFDSRKFMDAKLSRRSALCTQYAVAAASLAVRDASLDLKALDPDRIGIVEGTTVSGIESAFRGYMIYNQKGLRAVNPFDVINGYCGEGSSIVALALGIKGLGVTYCSGCASGNDAIGYGQLMIRQDETDVMLVGATDDNLNEVVFGGFCVLKVMSKRVDNPKEAMRPFDRERDGFVPGEGSAFLVLEELSHALLRGARIYAEVLGHGRSCEAYHFTETHPEGTGFRRAIEKALRIAQISPEEVDYINAHGTATKSNDPIETKAIKKVFGPSARRLVVSSTKPITGHLMGAAGAVESVVCALAIKHGIIPPTINLTKPAEGCDLNYAPRRAINWPVRVAMNLNSGFGGKNACLILKRYP